MNRQEIYKEIMEEVRRALPPDLRDAEIELREVIKNNDTKMTALIIRGGNSAYGPFSISPTLYLEPFCDRIMDPDQPGSVEDKIYQSAQELIEIYRKSVAEVPEEFHDFEKIYDYDQMKHLLTVRACDPVRNPELLENAVYHLHGDYAAVFYIKNSAGSIKVNPDIVREWGVTEQQLEADVRKNYRMEQYVLSPLSAMVGQLQGFLPEGQEQEDLNYLNKQPDESLSEPMFILTNQDSFYGANAVFFPELLERVSQAMGGDYYVLPSSVHELLVLPQSLDGFMTSDAYGLQEIVRNVNETLLPEEVLSDQVQYYDSHEKKLVNAVEHQMAMERSMEGPDRETPGLLL